MIEAAEKEPFAVSIARVHQQYAAALQSAKDLVVDDQTMYEIGSEELIEIVSMEKKLETKHKEDRAGAVAALKEIDDGFRAPRDFIVQAKKIVKDRMSGYMVKVEEERQREAAIARAKADEERKVAEAEAQAAQEKADAAAKKAEAEVDFDKKRAAQDEATRAAGEATKASTAAVVAAPVVAPATPKVKGGAGLTTRYGAECLDLMTLLKYIVGNPQYINLVKVDQPALNRLGNTLKDGFSVGGCAIKKTQSVRTGRRT